jgi:hypothetical protein
MPKKGSCRSNCPLLCCLSASNAPLFAALSAALNPVLDHDKIADDRACQPSNWPEPYTTRSHGLGPVIADAASRLFARKGGSRSELVGLT